MYVCMYVTIKPAYRPIVPGPAAEVEATFSGRTLSIEHKVTSYAVATVINLGM